MTYIAIRRFLELTLPEVLLSVIFSVLFLSGFLPSHAWLVQSVVIILLMAYFVFHIFMLRAAYIGTDNIPVYVGMNLMANLCFIVLNILLYVLLDKTAYTWMFSVFKAVHYVQAGIGIATSMVMVQFLMLLLIFIAPFGLIPPSYLPEGELPIPVADDMDAWLDAIERE